MCHPGVPEGHKTPETSQSEVLVPVTDGEMPALLVTPPGGAGPGVVVVGDFFGGRAPFYEHLGAVLAASGFTALVPEYLFREGPLDEMTKQAAFARRAKLDDTRTLADLTGCVEHLRSSSEVTGGRVGTVGFCLGGTFVLNLAATVADLATVCYYGFPGGTPGAKVPNPPPIDQVDSITGPVLGFWGDGDESVPGDDIAAYVNKMRASSAEFEHVIYPGHGHGFLSAAGPDFADEDAGTSAAADSWRRTVAFLGERLAAPA